METTGSPESRVDAPRPTAAMSKSTADPTVMVEDLRRTWKAGAGRITVTYPAGGSGGYWDIEQSSARTGSEVSDHSVR